MEDMIYFYPVVDSDRIGILGICGGGGYTLRAAQTDKRFKVVVTLSAFNSGLVRRNGFLDSHTDSIQERLQQATNARALEVAGGEVLYSSDLLELTDKEAEALPYDLYREGYEYYGKTHSHPKSTFRYTLSSLLDLCTFDASENMDIINQPLLMMAGSIADTFYLTEKAFAAATGTNDKELFLIKGATHIQTYWRPDYVAQAVEKAVDFFDKRF